ncbi:2713_t:CDS:10 [Acaulospora morrowiae]|uniref:Ubiquitin carboxyl-terminal hydrolase n=1 Tax=Acaulospora morrowiae TaxID=94023 RepID=A0A9N9HHJ9_9GLOM|nr:2713_t:CDS:10 [Acaulospora morrowiae]
MSSLLLSHKERAEGPWVKLQSDPNLFTALMYDLGVKGVKATEVFVLDQQDNFDDLGQIYGIVFLFKMFGGVTGDLRGLHKGTEYEPIEENPKNVYFANQVVENACATLAVLNIVLNCPQLEIDQELKEFKDFTWDLPPATRGFSITNHPTFRKIHNSMARHPEDSLIVEEAVSKKKTKVEIGVMGEVYHYIAYVPVDGQVWQLDGLYPHPVKIGKYDDHKHWYDAARGVINERIESFQAEDMEYVLLAITKDQLGINQDRLNDCLYIKKLVEERLDEINNSWREANFEDVDVRFTNEDQAKAIERGNAGMELLNLSTCHDDVEKLEQLRSRMIGEIRVLLEDIDREIKFKEVERERRTFDYGPFFREFISILHERGELKGLLAAAPEMYEGDEQY